MFGTREKFDLTHAVYGREGSAFFLIENYYSHLLQLSSYKPGAWMDWNEFLFTVRTYEKGMETLYTYIGDPGSIRLTCPDGVLDIVFTYDEYLKIRTDDGIAISFEADRYRPWLTKAAAIHGVCFLPDGTFELTAGTYGKLRFRPLKGSITLDAEPDASGYGFSSLKIKLDPDENGVLDVAVHEDMVEVACLPDEYPSMDALKKDGFDRYEDFKKNYKVPAKRYEELFKYASQTVWSRRVKPGGNYKAPMILMHYEYLNACFSWQQSFNGLSMMGNPEEGWRMICAMFDYQEEDSGQLLGNVGYLNANRGIQPPIQGFALDFLTQKCGDSFLTPESCEKMLPKFEKWINFWITTRSAGRGDDVTMINSPNDSGWDDATIFQDGFPAVNPDLIAFMILLLEKTGVLAEKCGKTEVAKSYYDRSKKLLKTLLDEFWDGEKFVTFHNGKPVNSLSVACYQPIILGKRLPQDIIDKVTEKLLEEDNFLTAIGLASESLNSTNITYSTHSFVHGRVVAPVQLFLCAGLNLAGKKKEAAYIAKRFCDHADVHGCILGYPPRTDTYKATGKPIYIQPGPIASDGWPWSSWCACSILTLITCIIPEGEA